MIVESSLHIESFVCFIRVSCCTILIGKLTKVTLFAKIVIIWVCLSRSNLLPATQDHKTARADTHLTSKSEIPATIASKYCRCTYFYSSGVGS